MYEFTGFSRTRTAATTGSSLKLLRSYELYRTGWTKRDRMSGDRLPKTTVEGRGCQGPMLMKLLGRDLPRTTRKREK